MVGNRRHIHDPEKAAEFACALGLMVGGHHPFVGDWQVKGLYAYRSGKYKGQAYFGAGGSESDRLKDIYDPTKPGESNQKYRPWNRDDPKIPEDIRQKLIRLEERMNPTHQPSTKPSQKDMPRQDSILVSEHSVSKYNGIYSIQTSVINGKPWYKNNSGCMLYFYNANSGGGPSWSLDDRSQDGTKDWFRGGWIEPPNSGGPPLGTRTWKDAGTIRMESVPIPDEDSRDVTSLRTGWYRIEHADGSLVERVRVHRDERKTRATNEFIATGDLTGDVSWYVEGRTVNVPKFDSTGTIQADGNIAWGRDGNKAIYEGNAGVLSTGNQSIRNDGGKIALRSVHGKFLSAQPDGRAEWNRVIASDWEFFELGKRDGRKITLRSTHGKYVSAQPDGSVQINRDHAPSGGWEEFTVETRPGSTPGDAHDFVHLKSVHGFYLSAQADGTAQWNRDHAPPGGWEDIQFVPQGNTGEGAARAPESIEMLEDASSKPAQMTVASNKNAAKIAFVVGIALFSMGFPLLIVGSISTGEDKLAMLVPGAVMSGIGAFLLMGTAISPLGSSLGKQEAKDRLVWPLLEVLSFNHRQPVRFSITNPPEHDDAWVGLYPANAGDQDHGDRWHYLRDIDVNNATLPGQEQGAWSLRLFSDGRYTLDHRVDFELRASSKEEVWMREAKFGDQRLNGLIPDHRNNFTKKVTTSKIVAQHKVGNLTHFETDDTTYLVYDHDLKEKSSKENLFWDVN